MRCNLVVLLLSLALSPVALAAEASSSEFFETHIRPLLVDECYRCHSATSEKIKGDLLLDSRAGLLKGGESQQPCILPGNPDGSLLIKAVQWSDPDLQMPPKKKLSASQIADLVAWIKMGAPDPRAAALPSPAKPQAMTHWAFQPVHDPTLPNAAGATPIDRFINARLQSAGISAAPPADKRTLIRRATYDLIGLPPTAPEIDAFLADESPHAFTKVIDRLLASPQYGERWGRFWLDLARYADTAGESANFPIPQAYRYRNYVIDAFNADLPYDQFLQEQIAGDLLPSRDEPDRQRKIIATGYIATAKRFGVDPENYMNQTIDDVIDTLGKSTMALSLGCARCHDHKFDPVTSKEYYSLYGIFASTRFPFPGAENHKFQSDFVPLAPKAEGEALLAAYEAKLTPVRTEANRLMKAWTKARGSPEEAPLYNQWQAAMHQVSQITATGPGCPMAYALAESQGHDVQIMKRGDPQNPGDLAPRGFLTILGGQKLPAEFAGSGRLQLAQWIASPANPLTARVMVNRIWQHHFSYGLVRTPSDFGLRGSRPTHPELLDYLASRFVESGWSVKALHRAILLSDVYQRSSDGPNYPADANNELLSHFNRRRLDAEEIRDSLLVLAGNLDPSPGGTLPFPPADQWRFSQHSPFSASYETLRRSVYTFQNRFHRSAFFATFDGPDPNTTTAERTSSTTPLQSLYMMNDAFVHNESMIFARQLTRADSDPAGQIRRALLMIYDRPADAEEVQTALAYEQAYAAKDQSSTSEEKPLKSLAAYVRVLLSSNEFFYVD